MSAHRPEHVPEEFLGQILVDGKWADYSRGTEAAARRWQTADPANRRIVDWIYKERIIVAPSDPDEALLAAMMRRLLADACVQVHEGFIVIDGSVDFEPGERDTVMRAIAPTPPSTEENP